MFLSLSLSPTFVLTRGYFEGSSLSPSAVIPLICPDSVVIRDDMPRTVVELSEHANRVVNVVKAMEGLPGKSAAIERIVEEYEEKVLDPHLRPEIVEDLQSIRKGKFRKVRSLGDVLNLRTGRGVIREF